MKRQLDEDNPQQNHLPVVLHQDEISLLPQLTPENTTRRGRPLGSKNKPKQTPILITTTPNSKPSDFPMSPYILEILPGNDIIASVNAFSRKRNTGLCIITGNGTVSSVTLKQPFSAPPTSVTFNGIFEVLSIAATILPIEATSDFAVSVAGQQGQVMGGLVVGKLMAVSKFYVIASVFNWPENHVMLPIEDDSAGKINGSVEGGTPGENSAFVWASTAGDPVKEELPPY